VDEDGTEWAYPVTDLGRRRDLIGSVIKDYTMTPVEGGSQVRIEFTNGKSVGFEDIDDNTTIMAQQPGP
jgi:hypothetical protein